MKRSGRPDPYIVQIPCWDPGTQQRVLKKVPLWLPHELVATIATMSERSFLDQGSLDPWAKNI